MSAPKKLRVVVKSDTDLNVKVSDRVHKVWRKYRQNKSHNPEACGVLIGGYTESADTIYLESCTSPQKDDERTRTRFKLKSNFHQKVVDAAHKRSKGKQFYIGTWHSHPESNPSPSFTDRRDWKKCIKRNSQIGLFVFAIIGTESVSIYSYRQGNLMR